MTSLIARKMTCQQRNVTVVTVAEMGSDHYLDGRQVKVEEAKKQKSGVRITTIPSFSVFFYANYCIYRCAKIWAHIAVLHCVVVVAMEVA